MAFPDDAGGIVVSLQDRGAGPVATESHRGFGVLHGADLAVVAVPPGVTWESAFELEVLVCPTAAETDNVVERHRVRHVELASLESSPEARMVLLRLATASRYGTQVPELPPYDVLVEALSAHGELREALVDLDLFPHDLHDLDASALSFVDALEEAQRARLQVDRLGARGGHIASCLMSPKCQPFPPH